MVEYSNDSNQEDRIRSSARNSYAFQSSIRAGDQKPVIPVIHEQVCSKEGVTSIPTPATATNPVDGWLSSTSGTSKNGAEKDSPNAPLSGSTSVEDRGSGTSDTVASEKKPNIALRFCITLKAILLSTWLNVLLVFVPLGIALQAAGVTPTVVFAMNAIAIIPLAGLLSFATESVATELGDTIGALLNVTFGNAVELIIFIALVKNEIRIVQASLLGSILANLLLILGMCFLFGGLRFREQIYNSTVTQMSACLLSLSVMSLLLPVILLTAFHASFTDNAKADKAVLQVSRGTSVILLFVYVLYLLFQLKSHAYMYQSTPQHVIDEESHPGVLAEMLGSSSSSDSSSSSSHSASDTDLSSQSNTTAKKIKRVLRGRRRRKSSASSKETPSIPSTIRTPSNGTMTNVIDNSEFAAIDSLDEKVISSPRFLSAIASGDEADTDGEREGHFARARNSTIARNTTVNFRDFEDERGVPRSKSPVAKLKKQKSKRKRRKSAGHHDKRPDVSDKSPHSPVLKATTITSKLPAPVSDLPHTVQTGSEIPPKRPFNLRNLSVRGTIPAMPIPAIPRMLSSTVFSATNSTGLPPNRSPMLSTDPRSLRQTKSLTDLHATRLEPPTQAVPQFTSANASRSSLHSTEANHAKKHMSRTSAILLLLISTGLVAVCAEFLVDSINYLVQNTSVSEAFVGLIILPIVGNAAEHVTAVTVASKNKMDLAIGVAVGSSIQIAIFVTPVIVLLGWILAKDMSLYFSLFETISLFASAFIVNFLVLDGRSNYLEGALLIAGYVIIALSAFFYPDSSDQSVIGGAAG